MVTAYERMGIVSLKEVLSAIAANKPLEFEGCFCYTSGNRLLTYHVHGVSCCVPGCSVRGEYFAVEKAIHQQGARYHLNLYGMKDGREVMLTSDHRIPKSRGGRDVISNRQPMCEPHNAKKGNQLIYL
jgi:hypothetical protein